jgi:protease-4
VVRIDSPGGAVAPSQEIFDAVKTLKTKKRVVVSMGSTAVSGGYYIACAADRIIANPGTVTGSIGALLQYSNREELLKKIGLESSVIKSGKFKDIGSPVRPMTSEEKDLIQGVLDDIHDQFVEVVSISRNISVEKLRPIADGRIFTGRQALKLGLIDDLGDMDYSVEVAAKLAGMKEKPELIYPKEKRINFWKFFSDELISSLVKHLRAESIGFQYSPLY